MIGFYAGDLSCRNKFPLTVAIVVYIEQEAGGCIFRKLKPEDARLFSRSVLHRYIVIYQVGGIVPGAGDLQVMIIGDLPCPGPGRSFAGGIFCPQCLTIRLYGKGLSPPGGNDDQKGTGYLVISI